MDALGDIWKGKMKARYIHPVSKEDKFERTKKAHYQAQRQLDLCLKNIDKALEAYSNGYYGAASVFSSLGELRQHVVKTKTDILDDTFNNVPFVDMAVDKQRISEEEFIPEEKKSILSKWGGNIFALISGLVAGSSFILYMQGNMQMTIVLLTTYLLCTVAMAMEVHLLKPKRMKRALARKEMGA